MSNGSEKPRILIVDDDIGNIKLLANILRDSYELSIGINGTDALETANAEQPDLILLDIQMPDMDGFTVCEKLKVNERTREIGVIFITGHNDVKVEIRGLELGAVDFISKPINPPVILARIKTHLLVWQNQKELKALSMEREKIADELRIHRDQLEDMVLARTKQLAHAERLATLGTFSAGMAHEINNPNSFISGNIDFLQQYCTLAEPILMAHKEQDPSGRVGSFLEEAKATLEGMKDGSRRIAKIVDSLKAYSRGGMETDKVECRLAEPIFDAQYLLQHRLKNRFHLTIDVANDLYIICDRQQISQVFVNLLSNAMDALETMGENYEKRVKITGEPLDDHLWIKVSDNGPGIPEDALGRIFDPFYTSKGKTKGTGLGLSVVHGIITDHAGQITVYSTSIHTQGAEFIIILPNRETYKKIRERKRR
ncbi:MAG: Histidine kinase protein [Magnetococcales bacterium]|nr:Histidine kinase protein [Magnetococcales bacterium]HIJ85884.1 response regulator [Magnetococcales bacterium]